MISLNQCLGDISWVVSIGGGATLGPIREKSVRNPVIAEISLRLASEETEEIAGFLTDLANRVVQYMRPCSEYGLSERSQGARYY